MEVFTYIIYLNINKCSDRSSASLMHCIVSVFCGGHYREECGACPFSYGIPKGKSWCHGFCKWVQNNMTDLECHGENSMSPCCIPMVFINFIPYTKYHFSHCRMPRSRQIRIKRWLKKQRKKKKKRRKRKMKKVEAFGFNFLLLFYFFQFT